MSNHDVVYYAINQRTRKHAILQDAEGMHRMVIMDMEEDAADEEIHSQFPCIKETLHSIDMMGIRARFNPEMNGPYLVRFPEDMPEDMVTQDLVQRIVFGRDKKDLQAFLESAKL